jgi:uncharacterized membrane protein YccC
MMAEGKEFVLTLRTAYSLRYASHASGGAFFLGFAALGACMKSIGLFC